jgi:Zn-dependent protease
MLGGTLVLLLFASVLVHELGHSLTARARGLHVSNITLFVFGGMTVLEEEVDVPDDEIVVYVVGPIASLGLAGLFWGIGSVGDPESRIVMALPYLSVINLVLAAIYLVPGFPLDGGRVLRGVVWKATGSAYAGVNWASWLGQAFAALLVALAAIQFFDGNYLGAAWNVLIGWFLNGIAKGSRHVLVASPVIEKLEAETLAPARIPRVDAAARPTAAFDGTSD